MTGVFTPTDFHPDRPGVIAPVPVDPRGRDGPTRAQARGRRWRASSHGLYVPAWTDEDSVEQRVVEAAAVLPSYGGVTGWAALGWMRGRWFTGALAGGAHQPVVLATGGIHIRAQRGIEICEEKLEPDDLTVVDGLRVTTAVRSVCFAMRYAPTLWHAVTVLDMAAYSDLVSIEELTAYALAHPAWTGIPRCREAIPLADENSWSPAEVEMRKVWTVMAGHPRPLCNRPLFDHAGRHLGTPDLVDPVAGVVGEYDGALHLAGRRRATDLQREAAFRAVGLEHVTMVGADRAGLGAFVSRLDEAYHRARYEPPDTRRWTLDPPPWWTLTHAVDDRRRLTADQRRRLLRYRDSA